MNKQRGVGIAHIPFHRLLNAVMGRRTPSYDHNNLSLIHPLLHFSFLAATLFATIAIIAALCGVRSRKKSSRRHPSHPPSSDPQHTAKDMDARSHQTSEAEISPETENNEMQRKELPLPPALQQPRNSTSHNNMKKTTSERRLSFSLSLKVPRSLSVAKGVGDGRKKEKSKTEDSVWMKTIILGDRCVPEEGDDGVIYEQKGKKISAYHPRNSSSISISRRMSIDQDAISGPNIQRQNINQKDM